MTRFQLIIAILSTSILTLGGGVLHGRLSVRWGASKLAVDAADALEELPDRFGAWRRVQRNELDEIELQMLRPYGYLEGVYVDRETGAQVTCFVLVGPTGETAVHNPEICYSSRNFSVVGERRPAVIDSGQRSPDELWSMTFRENNARGNLLRVYFGWSDGARWEAAEGGRYKYAGLPYLYKIELATMVPPDTDLESADPCRSFLADFLPTLRSHMARAERRGLGSLFSRSS